MDLLERFREAGQGPSPWRAATFWSWNDRLDPEEVRRQIREFARGGLGGVFMHARRGLETPYMGPEWLEAVRAAIDEGSHTGIRPWLYDEDCWPSGAASGRVYSGREAFRQKHLIFEEIQPKDWEPSESTVAVFVAEKDAAGKYRSFRRLAAPRSVYSRPLRPTEAAVHFAYRTGEYVDVFNRDATEEFLKTTHEVYANSVGREFGRAIAGIFTDEPQYAGHGHRLPWSLELPKFFRRACRYELVDHLPELFFPVGPYRKTRFDFFQTATRLFLLAWTMPVYQWCERNGLALTGHMMAEDTMLSQVQWIGAAMPHYEYMHIPGIDLLGRGLGSPVLVKQVTSAAAQLGRPRTISEMFGCSGWNAGFDDLRWIAEWQFVLGLNLICTHLSSYTLRGVRKRDYPPSIHYHQPWWPQFYLWNDYMARLLAVLTEGAGVADVLVIHPMSSAWAEYSPNDKSAVEELDKRLRRTVEFVLGTHADFHFGDELILERQGRVAEGELAVGAGRYRTVVVPDATNLRKSTVRLLERFKQAGGKIVFAGRIPDLVDGEPSGAVAALARKCLRADPATARGRTALRRALDGQLEILEGKSKDAQTVLAHWRRAGKDNIFFFLNADERRTVKATVRLPAVAKAMAGTVIRLDPATGQSWQVDTQTPAGRSGRAAFAHTFRPRESLLLVQTDKADDEMFEPPAAPPSRKMRLGGRWNVKRLDPNVLVLDTASWRTDEGTYSEPMPIIDIQQELMRRGTQEAILLRMEFDCAIADLKGRRLELVIEQPQNYEMWYNGMRTPLADLGPFWDSAFRRVGISLFVKQGANVIELKRPWHQDERRGALLAGRASGWEARTAAADVELESVYVIGDFGVAFPRGSRQGPRSSRWMQGRPRMVGESPRLAAGDLVRAGYPFFVGRLSLEREVMLRGEPSPDSVLELPPFSAITATVIVNGDEAGTVWKAPRAVPVGSFLKKGRNRIAVTLTTSLRNMLGPHHHPEGELYFVHPGSFACGSPGRAARQSPTRQSRYGDGATGKQCLPNDFSVVAFGLGGDVVLRY